MAYNWKKFMHGLENYGLAVADGSLSAVGAANVIKPEMYIGENKEKWAKAGDIYGGITQAALPLAMNIVAPGSGAIVSTVQKGVSGAMNQNATDPNKATSAVNAAGQAYNQYQDFQGTQDIMNGLNVLQSLSSMPMAFGGMNPQPTVELEKQEVLRTPQGQIRKMDAPPHSQGGTGPMNLPNQTNVLSDRLKSKSGKTFAEEGKALDTKRWEKILNETTDPYKKTTAKRMIEAANKKMTKLFAEQELMKANKMAKDLGKLQTQETSLNTKKMLKGGAVNTVPTGQYHPLNSSYKASNIYDNKTGEQLFYGPNNSIVPYSHIKTKPNVRQATQAGDRYSGVAGYDPVTGTTYSKMPGGGTYNVPNYDPNQEVPLYYTIDPNSIYPPQEGVNFWDEAYGSRGQGNMIPVTENNTPEFVSIPSRNINQIPVNIQVPTINPTIQTLPEQEPTAMSKFKTGMNNAMNKVGDELGQVNPYFTAATLGNFMGPIYDIYRGARGGDEVNFDRIKPEFVDYSKARRMGVQETNRGFNATENYVKNATAGNTGAYLANIGAANAMRDRQNQNMISQSYENEKNTNAQIKNAANAQNAQIQMQESIARQQEKDIAKNTLATGLYNFGASMNQYGNDMQLKGNEPVLKALIATGDYDFVYSGRTPIGIKYKQTGKTTYFNNLTKSQQKEKERLEANLPK